MKTAILLCGLLLLATCASAQAQGAQAQEVQAKEASPDLQEALRAFMEENGAEMPRYDFATPDLDGDGHPDAVVYLMGFDWCGSGGCTMLVYRRTEDGLRFVSKSILTRLPIRLSPETENGWHTLVVWARDVGDVLMRFDGKEYPGSPGDEPKASAAQITASTVLLDLRPAPESE